MDELGHDPPRAGVGRDPQRGKPDRGGLLQLVGARVGEGLPGPVHTMVAVEPVGGFLDGRVEGDESLFVVAEQ